MSIASKRTFSSSQPAELLEDDHSKNSVTKHSFRERTGAAYQYRPDSESYPIQLTPFDSAEASVGITRVHVEGKFLYKGLEKFYLKGTTYGTFSPNDNDELFPERSVVEKDFRSMIGSNINAIRVYTIPPKWFLDLAHTHGLMVLVGIPWEQHLAFLDDEATTRV